jgi:putative addiction module killer protein
MVEIRQTRSYADWFERLRDLNAKARIDVRIRRLSLGNAGDVKPVGAGVSELRIDYGPGYRVYFCRRAKRLSSFSAAATSAARQGTSLPLRRWLGN